MPARGPHGGRPASGRERGGIIIYLVVALVAFGVLSLAGLTRFGATVLSVLSPDCAISARLMAESGVRYAMARLRACTDETCVNNAITAMNGTTYTVNAAKGQSFTISLSYNASAYSAVITATGSGCNIASPNITATSGTVNLPVVAANADPSVTFAKDIASFIPTPGIRKDASGNPIPGIATDTVAKTVIMGNNVGANAASIWYTGSNSFCTSGNCTMATGVCAYWEFQFNPSSTGDGYAWVILSGDTNTAASNGGDTNATGQGEYMGYSGPGFSGKGIQPPKLGLEFDAYYNACNTGPCGDGTRCDNTNVYDHVAFIFWGSNTASWCSGVNTPTFDDNRHGAGAGSASEPINSYSLDGGGDGWDGYYWRPGGDSIWMERGDRYVVRYELDRPSSANADGNYVYLERAWVKKSTDTYSANMGNCSATVTDTPSLIRSFALTPTLHNQLAKAFFGFTEGTGGATQYVTLSNFTLRQKGAPAAVTTPTVPTTGLVAAYTFSEVQGATAKDTSGNANHLTGSGSAMWGPDMRSVSGGSMFVAGDGYAYANDSASLDLGAAGTVACWIKLRNYVNNAGMVHKGDSAFWTDEAYSLELTNSNKFGLYIYNSLGQYQFLESAANALPSTGRWYHVAAVWDNSKIYLYVNGVLSSSKNNTTPKISVRSTGGRLNVGAQLPGPSYGFDGLIDDVYIYNRSLSAAEIAGLAAGAP